MALDIRQPAARGHFDKGGGLLVVQIGKHGVEALDARGTGGNQHLTPGHQHIHAVALEGGLHTLAEVAAGVGVFTVNGKMIDVAFIPGAQRTLRLAKACGMYEGDLV